MAEFGKGPISGDLVHPEAEGFEGATAEDIEACREEHRKICERRGRRVMAGKILGKDLKVPDPSEDIPVRAGRFEEGECRVEYSEGFPEGSRERHYRCMDCGWSGPQSEAGVKPELSRIQLLCPSCLRPDTIKFES